MKKSPINDVRETELKQLNMTCRAAAHPPSCPEERIHTQPHPTRLVQFASLSCRYSGFKVSQGTAFQSVSIRSPQPAAAQTRRSAERYPPGGVGSLQLVPKPAGQKQRTGVHRKHVRINVNELRRVKPFSKRRILNNDT